MLDGGGGSLGTAEGRITVDTSQAESSLSSLGSAMTSFDSRGAAMGKSFGTSMMNAGQSMQQVGRIGLGLGAAITAPFVGAAKSALDFESTMSGVNAVMDLQGTQFQELSGLAQQMGKDTIFSGTEAAEGIEAMGKAGLSATDILGGAAAAAADLAAAGGTDIPYAAEVISAALNAFNLTGAESVQVADQLAGAANASLADVKDLGSGFAQVAGIASALGVPMEELITQLAIMTDMGLSGSDAATSLKTAMTQLVAPLGPAAKEAGRLGVSFRDANGEFIGIKNSAELLVDTFDALGMSEADQVASLKKLVGQDGYRALLFAMQEVRDEQRGGTKGWDEYSRAVNEQGAAAKFAEERMNNTAGAIERLKGTIQTLGENLGMPIVQALRGPIEAVNTFLGALVNLPPAIFGVVAGVGSIVGVATLAAGAFVFFGGHVAEAVGRLALMGVTGGQVVGVLARIATIASVAGAAIGIAAIAYTQDWFGLRGAIDSVREALGGVVDDFNRAKTGAENSGREYNVIEENVIGLAGALTGTGIPALVSAGHGLSQMAEGAFQARKAWADLRKKGVTPVVAGLRAGAVFFDEWLGGFGPSGIGEVLDDAANKLETFGNAFRDLRHVQEEAGLSGLAASISAVGGALDAALGTDVGGRFHTLAQAVQGTMNAFQGLQELGLNPVAAGLGALETGARVLGFQQLGDALGEASRAAQVFGSTFEQINLMGQAAGMTGLGAALNAFGHALDTALGTDVSGYFSRAASAINATANAFNAARERGANPFIAALDGVNAGIQSLLGADAQRYWDDFTQAIGNATEGVTSFISAGVGEIASQLQGIGQAIMAGDFRGAIDLFVSGLQQMRDTLVELGARALDWAINVGAPELIGWAAENAGRFGEWLKEQLTGAADLAGQVLATIQGWWMEVGEPQLRGWIEGGKELIGPKIQAGLNFAGQVLGTIKDWILEVGAPQLRGWVEQGADMLGPLIQKAVGGAGQTLGRLASWILEIGVPQLTGWVQGGAAMIGPELQRLVDGARDTVARLASWLLEVGIPELTGAAQDLGGVIQQALSDAVASVGQISEQFTDWVIELAAGDVTNIDLDAVSFPTLIGAAIEMQLGTVAGAASDALGSAGTQSKISEVSTNLGHALGEAIVGILTGAVASIPDIASLAGNVFMTVGNIGANLAIGIMDGLYDGMMSIFLSGKRTNELGDGPQGEVGANLTQQFVAMVDGLIASITDVFLNLENPLEGIDNPFDSVLETVQGWSDELLTGLQTIGTDLTGQISGAAEALRNAPQNVLNAIQGKPPVGFDTVGRATGEAAASEYVEGFRQGTEAGAAQGALQAVGVGLSEATGQAAPTTPPETAAEWLAAGGAAGIQAASDTARGFGDAYTTNVPPAIEEAVAGVDLVASGQILANATDRDLSEGVTKTPFTSLPRAIQEKVPEAIDHGITTLPSVGTGSAETTGSTVGSGIDTAIAAGIMNTTMTQTESAIGTKVGEAAQVGASQVGAQGADAARGAAASGAGSIGAALDAAMSTSIAGVTLTNFSQAIGMKIGEAVTQGLAATGGQAKVGTGQAAGGVGAAIAASLASAIGETDFSGVGTAISQKISSALTTGLSGTAAQEGGGTAAGAGLSIGTTIAGGLASSVAAADFSAVGTAISTKIGEAVQAGMAGGGGGIGTGEGAGAAAGGGIGTAIAQSIAADIAGADFTAIGQAIATQIGAVLASTTTLSGATTTMVSAAVDAGVQAASGASAVGEAIATNAGSVVAASGALSGATATMVSAAVGAGTQAATAATGIGTAVATNAGSGAASSTAFSGGVTTMVSAAVSAGVSAAAEGAQIGQAVATAAGGAAASATEFNGAVTTMVGAAISAGVDAAAGASAIGAAVSQGAASGVILTAMNSAVATMVSNGIAAGMAAAEAASPSRRAERELGKPISEGAALGVLNNIALMEDAGERLANAAFEGAKRGKKGKLPIGRELRVDTDRLTGSIEAMHALGESLGNVPGLHDFGSQVNAIAGTVDASKGEIEDSTSELLTRVKEILKEQREKVRAEGESTGRAASTSVATGIDSGTGVVAESARKMAREFRDELRAGFQSIPTIGRDQKFEAKGIVTNLEAMEMDVDSLYALGERLDQVPGLHDFGDQVRAIAGEIEAHRGPALDSATTLLKDIEKIIRTQKKAIDQAVDELSKSMSKGVGTGIKDAALGAATAATEAAPKMEAAGGSLADSLTAGLYNANMSRVGGDLVGEAATGIKEGTPPAMGAAEKAGTSIGGAVPTGVADACKEAGDVGQDLTKSCVPDGIEAGLGTATKVAKNAGEDTVDALLSGMNLKKSDTKNAFGTAGKDFGDSMGTGIGSKTGTVKNSANNLADSAKVNAAPQGKSVGATFAQGIIDAINEYIPKIKEAGGKAAKAAEDGAKEESKSKSPSLVWMELTRDWMRGGIMGMDSMLPQIAAAGERAAGTTAAAFAGQGVAQVSSILDRRLATYGTTIVQALNNVDRSLSSAPTAAEQAMAAKMQRTGGDQQATPAEREGPPIQIGNIELRPGDPGYDEGVAFVTTMRRVAGQY